MLEILKRQTVAANRLLLKDRMSGDVPGTVTAIDRETNTMIICPADADSGLDSLVLLPLDEDYKGIQNIDFPHDIVLHAALYRKYPEIVSIAHIYPDWCSTFSRIGKGIPMCDICGAKEYGTEIPCIGEWVEYHDEDDMETIERKRAENVISSIHAKSQGVVLLRNDGLLSWGSNPMQALLQTERIEIIASNTAKAELMGGAARIPPVIAEKYHEEHMRLQHEMEEAESNGAIGDHVAVSDQKKINLELLVYFDKVCRENGIHYSLTGGTLLGAIRHGGFIPWDDDVDVFMTRPEYKKLSDVFPDDHRFIFMDRTKDRSFNFVYGRLLDTRTLITEAIGSVNAGTGLFLDISAVDGLPNNAFCRRLHISYMRVIARLRRSTVSNPQWKSYRQKGPFFRFLKYIVRLFTTHQFWNRRFEDVMCRYPFEKSETYVGNFTSQYGKREMMHKTAFDSYLDVEFEGHKFMVCQGYEEYLSNIYGDYLSYPSKKKRKGHHVYKAVWVK